MNTRIFLSYFLLIWCIKMMIKTVTNGQYIGFSSFFFSLVSSSTTLIKNQLTYTSQSRTTCWFIVTAEPLKKAFTWRRLSFTERLISSSHAASTPSLASWTLRLLGNKSIQLATWTFSFSLPFLWIFDFLSSIPAWFSKTSGYGRQK